MSQSISPLSFLLVCAIEVDESFDITSSSSLPCECSICPFEMEEKEKTKMKQVQQLGLKFLPFSYIGAGEILTIKGTVGVYIALKHLASG